MQFKEDIYFTQPAVYPLFNWVNKEIIKDFNNNKLIDPYLYTHLSAIKLAIPLAMMNYTMDLEYRYFELGTLKLYSKHADDSAIYGVIYYHDNVPQYLCIAPAYTSMDGEFRRSFISYDQFKAAYDNPIIAEIEKFVKVLIDKKIFKVTVDSINKEIATDIKDGRLPLQMFVIMWSTYYYITHISSAENHINVRFQNIIDEQLSKKFFAKMVTKYDISSIKSFLRLMEAVKLFTGDIDLPIPEVGQKIIPLSLKEYEEIGNIKYAIWRELYCNSIVRNLLINNVYSGISIPYGWFIVPMNDTLFDNDAMHERLRQSDKLRKVIDDVREIRTDLSYHETLAIAFDDPIEVAERNVLLTNFAVCKLTEFVGRTFGDVLKLLGDKHFISTQGSFLEDIELFHRYMFDIVYGLFCINSLGIIHGDLHLNNCTVYILTDNITRIENGERYYRVKNPSNSYNIFNETYVLKNHGVYICIIDFSRSIVEPTNKIYVENNVNSIDILKNVILLTYEYTFPEFFIKHKNKLEVAILRFPSHIYKLFTAYDVYTYTFKFRMMLEKNKDIIKSPIINKIYQFLDDLKKESESYLIDKMLYFIITIEQKPIHKVLPKDFLTNDKLFPNYQMLRKFFKQYVVNEQSLAQLAPTIIDNFTFHSPKHYKYDIDTNPPIYLKKICFLDGKLETYIDEKTIAKRQSERKIREEAFFKEHARIEKPDTVERERMHLLTDFSISRRL